ncbi:hypothetical protein [Pseudomonas alvandae]|jgi:hypothetical protein|uniref:Uncharacterized protein n=1 Tax=Pseudomonas canavaninivorans TaxID=2842348 RepID=A0ABX8QNP4_PSECO|nr:hypothetical protein [Pseudomonas alvandae]QXI55937.1 hypothetical protein KSS97_13705 [Pseudomonas alvandae]
MIQRSSIRCINIRARWNSGATAFKWPILARVIGWITRTMKAKWLYIFWGGMELLYLGGFCYLSISQGDIPFFSDLRAFVLLGEEHGLVSAVLFMSYLALNVSIIFSLLLFFLGSDSVRYVVYVQAPLRILLAMPSLVFLPLVVSFGDVIYAEALIVLLLFSEVLKVGSVHFYRDGFISVSK